MTGEERSREVAVLARFLHGEHGEEDEFEALDDEEREEWLQVAESARWFYREDAADLPGTGVRRALSAVEAEASTHGANYASGMRNARRILEQDLLHMED